VRSDPEPLRRDNLPLALRTYPRVITIAKKPHNESEPSMNRRVKAALIMSAIETLERHVVPSVESDTAQIMLDLAIRNLRLLQSCYGNRDQQLEKLASKTTALLAQSSALTGKPAPADTPSHPDRTDDGAEPGRVERQLNQLDSALCAQLPALLRNAADGNGKSLAVLADLISSHEQFLATQAPDLVDDIRVVYRGGRIDRTRKVVSRDSGSTIDAETLTAYLRRRFPRDPGIRAASVNVLAGGFSKITVLFDLIRGDGAIEKCVMRKNTPAVFMKKSVVDEFPLLEQVYKAGLTVAKPLWLEPDPAIFAGAFLVSAAAAGTSNVQRWSTRPGEVDKVSRQLAQQIASLHNLELTALGYADDKARLSAGEAMEAEIRYWGDLYNARKSAPYVLLDLVLEWLLQNVPAELYQRPAKIVHGDVGYHNLMVDEGRVTALLDWEFAHFGDPNEDVVNVRAFVEQVGDWAAFLKYYIDAGGYPVSPECETFFRIWVAARNPLSCIDAAYIFEHQVPDEIKLGASGYVFEPYLSLHVAKLVLNAIEA
jgi:aminoglycoside phosphotransferase (APT) family kinase protein